VAEVKAKLTHQAKWLEEQGAYRLLGVDEACSEAAVKKRYHRLSLKAHPDKGGDSATFQKLKVRWVCVLPGQGGDHPVRCIAVRHGARWLVLLPQ